MEIIIAFASLQHRNSCCHHGPSLSGLGSFGLGVWRKQASVALESIVLASYFEELVAISMELHFVS